MRTQQKYFCNAFLLISFLFLAGCNYEKEEKEKKNIEGIIVTAKYCYNDYPFSYYFEGSDSIGVNIYFAGQIFNNTADTLRIPSRQLDFYGKYDVPIGESLFYSIINGDSLFFTFCYMGQRISPNSMIDFNLQYYITPENPELLAIFKNINKDQTILDTITIRYATPDMQLEREGVLLPPITLDRSKKFRIKEAEYNSYFERIFRRSEYLENPPKEMLDKERYRDSILRIKQL